MGTSGTAATEQKKWKTGYESLGAPTGMSDDAMSGWRTQLQNINNKYKINGTDEVGDILDFGNSKAFGELDSNQQEQYYKDLNNFNALYNTVSQYDAEYMQQQKAAQKAEEYATARRAMMERYLPETLAHMGYANTGAASDALLKMQTNYDNYVVNAKNQAAQNQTDLMSRYQQSAKDWQSERNAEKQAEIEAGQELYNTYLNNIYTGKGLATNEVEAAFATGALTEQQRNELYEKASAWSGDGVTKVGDIPLKLGDDKNKAVPFFPDSATGSYIMDNMDVDVNNGSSHRQNTFLNDVMAVSSKWGEEMNGTLVDFNYGWTTKDNKSGTVYVFYWNPSTNKGEWRLTDLSRKTANDKYKERFYTGDRKGMEGSLLGNVRGKSFYTNFVDNKK